MGTQLTFSPLHIKQVVDLKSLYFSYFSVIESKCLISFSLRSLEILVSDLFLLTIMKCLKHKVPSQMVMFSLRQVIFQWKEKTRAGGMYPTAKPFYRIR